MTPEGLTWPGVDRKRAVTACNHLHRAAELLVEHRRLVLAGEAAVRTSWRTRAAAEHSRQARGFLGAIGFEHGARLYRAEGVTGP